MNIFSIFGSISFTHVLVIGIVFVLLTWFAKWLYERFRRWNFERAFESIKIELECLLYEGALIDQKEKNELEGGHSDVGGQASHWGRAIRCGRNIINGKKKARALARKNGINDFDSTLDELDLHRFDLVTAVREFDEMLNEYEINYGKQRRLIVITGKGIHSKYPLAPVIRPAVEQRLMQRGYIKDTDFWFQSSNDGRIIVKVK